MADRGRAGRSAFAGLAVAVLLPMGLAACGSDEDPESEDAPTTEAAEIDPASAPKDATPEEDCAARNRVHEALEGTDAGAVAEELHAAAAGLAEVGTKENLTDMARQGFEAYVAALAAVGDSEVAGLKEATTDREIADALDVPSADEDAVTVWLSGQINCE